MLCRTLRAAPCCVELLALLDCVRPGSQQSDYITHDAPGKAVPSYSFGSSPRDKHLTPASITPDVPFLDASVSTSIGAAPKFSFSKSPRLEDTGRSLAATSDFYSAEVSAF